MVVTPAFSSPAMTDHWIGAAPRQRGSSEPCTLMHPRGGMSSTARGSSLPYATTMTASGASARSRSCSSSFFSVAGWQTGMPRASASSLTGGAVSTCLRPCGLSGWVYTAHTSCPASSNARRLGTAKSGVPINTSLIPARPLPRLRAAAPRCPHTPPPFR